MSKYNILDIEKKWLKKWEETRLYAFDLNKGQQKLYCLVMFSYPSADKLHCGHWMNFGPTDTWARFKKMQGYNVFEPMGFDAFGLPAENYAIKHNIHPETSTLNNIKIMEGQLKRIGAMYDWNHELVTCLPEYYKWTQWLFLLLYNKKLAYRANAPVNWCPKCNTVLANEQVVGEGSCERCNTLVIKKQLTQWFFKITDYAERLLEGLNRIDWPEKTKSMQRNWIGKSEGSKISFNLENSNEIISVFTTRPDTLFGVTYMVLAPEHPLVLRITTNNQRKQISDYIDQTNKATEIDRVSTIREKTGVFTGSYAINPINGDRIPIWIADYVLCSYGTGAVMAVSAHDERDFEFAKKYNLPIKKVICPKGESETAELSKAFIDDGYLVNSSNFNGMESTLAKEAITTNLKKINKGEKTTTYRLRDWLVSRQRYWGAPIPIVHCEDCGEIPVSEQDLPVLLPKDIKFEPTGESPLAKCDSFVNTNCPKCGKKAKREVDTLDTFVCSSWYYLRYPDPKDTENAFDQEKTKKMLPVDKYVGGPEHACMHLLYARFFSMVLYDAGLINFTEPFSSLVHQGIILGPDGNRMSKSHGNVVSPDDYINECGSDIFRGHLMFSYEYTTGGAWDSSGIKAIERFYDRVYRLVTEVYKNALMNATEGPLNINSPLDEKLNKIRHFTIKEVTKDTDRFHFNTSLSRLMELTNELYRYDVDQKENKNINLVSNVIHDLIKLLAPFAPFLAEELWELSGKSYSIINQAWPKHDDKALVEETITIPVQVNGRIKEQIQVSANISDEELKKLVVSYGKIPSVLEGKKLEKIILVQRKLISLVVK